MRAWLVLLGGLLTWTAHFFALYAIASIFPGTDTARWLALAATAVAAAANGVILWRASAKVKRASAESFELWKWRSGFAGALLSMIAVLWQGLPALI